MHMLEVNAPVEALNGVLLSADQHATLHDFRVQDLFDGISTFGKSSLSAFVFPSQRSRERVSLSLTVRSISENDGLVQNLFLEDVHVLNERHIKRAMHGEGTSEVVFCLHAACSRFV